MSKTDGSAWEGSSSKHEYDNVSAVGQGPGDSANLIAALVQQKKDEKCLVATKNGIEADYYDKSLVHSSYLLSQSQVLLIFRCGFLWPDNEGYPNRE